MWNMLTTFVFPFKSATGPFGVESFAESVVLPCINRVGYGQQRVTNCFRGPVTIKVVGNWAAVLVQGICFKICCHGYFNTLFHVSDPHKYENSL